MQEEIITSAGTVLTPVALIDNDGLIVLFHSATSGTVLQSDGYHKVGHYSEKWVMADLNEISWKPFHGTITINIL